MRLINPQTLKTLLTATTLAVAVSFSGHASAEELNIASVRTNLMPTADENVDFNGDVLATVRGELQLARGGQAVVLLLSVSYESGGRSFERSRNYTVWTSEDGRTISRFTGPTSFVWSSELDAAGAEFGSCNTGKVHRITERSMRGGGMLAGSFVRELNIVGDTGGNDIETRGARFNCNAHLRSIVLNPIPVELNGGASSFELAGNSALFCPSRRNLVAYRDGLDNGDQDFGRGYTLAGSTVFRIGDGGRTIEANMQFRMAEDVPDHTTVELQATEVVARAPEGRRIVSFADGSTETGTFSFDAENVSGRRRLALTGDIPGSLPRINLTVIGDGDGNDIADSFEQCRRDSNKAKITLAPVGAFAVIME